jgi:hypothetical protein
MAVGSHSCHRARLHFTRSLFMTSWLASGLIMPFYDHRTAIITILLSDLDMFQNVGIRFAITHNTLNSTNVPQFPRDHVHQWMTTFIKISAPATKQGDCE